ELPGCSTPRHLGKPLSGLSVIAVNPYGIYPLFPGFAEGKIPFNPVRVLRSKISLFVSAEQIGRICLA
ncbi:hypothetical protein, partial [Ensifer sp. ENS12]|uniref:hypothetical protein n=1 Tax=Ensifer sp. ENS12 TaxID=2854774 RepID=UPI001C4678F4